MADRSLDTLSIRPSANLQAPACTWWQLQYPGSVMCMRLRIKRRICAIGRSVGARPATGKHGCQSTAYRFLAYYQVALRLGPRKNRQTSTALTSVSGALNAKPPEVTTQIQK
ncbi:hypothetical protein P692DRAFT_20915927 [Suillus brevipes Sb2]|nr:hypothetical protein P692DRAFT_20915927 [Suillus brevipes Sb2]